MKEFIKKLKTEQENLRKEYEGNQGGFACCTCFLLVSIGSSRLKSTLLVLAAILTNYNSSVGKGRVSLSFPIYYSIGKTMLSSSARCGEA